MPHVDEKGARKVAEAAREAEWRLPSFGKELFLGNLRMDLISPHPRPAAADRERGEAFLEKLEAFLRVLEPYGIRELAQSGVVSLSRGPRGIGTVK